MRRIRLEAECRIPRIFTTWTDANENRMLSGAGQVEMPNHGNQTTQ